MLLLGVYPYVTVQPAPFAKPHIRAPAAAPLLCSYTGAPLIREGQTDPYASINQPAPSLIAELLSTLYYIFGEK